MKVIESNLGEVVIVPAGTYILGDPCYSVPDHEWSSWLANSYGERDGNHVNVLCAETGSGEWVLGLSTGGDGVFPDQFGNYYGVDSGLIGLVPGDRALEKGSRVVTFDEPVECFIGSDNALHFGSIRIKLDGEY